MQFSVTFRHMEATEALKDYAKDRVQRIRKYFPEPIAVHVVMSTERYNHRADVNVQLHNGLKIAGHESTENMYSSIDLVVAKIERQVRPVTWSHAVLAERDYYEGEDEAVAERSESTLKTPEVAVVRESEKFHADPMSVAEAIMRLNLLDEQFLVFRRDDTGYVNVVYRRDDGSYGLIETRPPA
jgi:putative sigma-54 modulation protein